MPLLLLVSFIWAVSFGIIKDRLAGLDSTALGVVRIALAALVFLPFLRPKKINANLALRLAAIGAVEFGIMYLFYMAAFRYLAAYEVAIFTIFTPLWITFFDALAARRATLNLVLAALLAIAGAAVITWQTITPSHTLLMGFLLVQGSNIAFALGQIWYRRTRATIPAGITDASLFAFLYLGALAVTVATSLTMTNWTAFHPTGAQWLALVYLGVISSGLCFFWWNKGATRVNAATLAAFNNAKIPLAVACSLLIFRESANIPRLLIGGALLAIAILIAQRNARA